MRHFNFLSTMTGAAPSSDALPDPLLISAVTTVVAAVLYRRESMSRVLL
ncbi:MAG: hypothetical protein PVJ68_10390 [Candidatus Thiodiazotropha sp.]